MTADPGENDPDFVKRAAVELAAIVADSRRSVLDEHSHMYRWLTASLLALNGGAVVAMLGSESFNALTKFNAGFCFLLGIIFALLVAVGGQRAAQRALPRLNDQLGYWLAVSHDGQRVVEREQKLEAELKQAQRVGLVARACGWLSAIAFICGATAIGIELRNGLELRQNQERATLEGPPQVVNAPNDHP